MSIEQTIQLVGHIAWPIVAILALIVLRPYVAQLTRAASDLRELLNRSGEMVNLLAQVNAISEAMSDVKAMQEVERAARPEAAPTAAPDDVERLWKTIERQWQETRESVRAVAQSGNVAVNFFGNVSVRDAAKALVEKGLISQATAGDFIDLAAQYQYMTRTTTARSEFLNENVVAAYTKTATRVREALKAGL